MRPRKEARVPVRTADAGNEIKRPRESSFLPSRLQAPRHVFLQAPDRGTLHTILHALHRSIHRGRADLAMLFARSAARLCREYGTYD